MTRREFDDNDPYVVIEQRSTSVMPFFIGLAIGVGAALLLAPQSGADTRREIKRRALRARRLAERKAHELQDTVNETYQDARRKVEETLDTARHAVEVKKRQVTRAMDAGRAAARDARDELENRIATTKASYTAGVNAARAARTPPPDEPVES